MQPRDDYLVFGQPLIEDDDIEEVVKTLRSGWIGTGPKVAKYETEFKEYVGNKYAVALNSCTAALHLACLSIGVQPGDEIITTSMTFCATVNAVIHAGATPVLTDIDPETRLISPNEIRKKITNRTKAILLVHYTGLPCDMTEIKKIADEYGLRIIGDCAHAVETEWEGKNVSQFAELNCYSFYVTKNITTAEGGMITTDDEALANKIKILALHGMDKDAWKRFSDEGYKHYQVVYSGFKYNMTDIQASLGIHQLSRIEQNYERRAAIWNRYVEELSHTGLELPPDLSHDKGKHGLHLFTLLANPKKVALTRDQWLLELHKMNIGTGVHYLGLFEYDYYQKLFGWRSLDYPNAKHVSDQTFSIPLSPKLSDNDVTYVIESIKYLSNKFGR
ncbi:MAG: DegT/DnrJ/EryC1/StrS family aminotransferase [bacterium]